jgi:IS30 family transposase
VSLDIATRAFFDRGGVIPRAGTHVRVRQLSFAEREEIALLRAEGRGVRAIARRLGRAPSTISRELRRVTYHYGSKDRYRARRYQASVAQADADRLACRPRPAKLATNLVLRREVQARLALNHSPEQIAARLRQDFPDDPEMWVSHETIYQSLFVQGRGALRAELTRCLRTGRARRRPAGRAKPSGELANMVLLSERPAEVEDRAVPGHWEGDLIIGKANRSAIGTLVERQTRFVMLVALPHGRTAEAVRAALAERILALPVELRRSLTWDRGSEMAEHVRFTVETGVQVYFCDPHSPWQRGSNENTNGLVRQYFPKGTDLSVHDQVHLDRVARELNGRPRQTLGWMKPSEALAKVVALTG